MHKNFVCSALVSTAIFGVLSTSAATLDLQQGLNGYTGTRDDTAIKSEGAGSFTNQDDQLWAYPVNNAENFGTVVGFDVSALPAGATVTSATLNMTFYGNVNFGNGTTTTWAIKNPAVQWKEGQVSFYYASVDQGNVAQWEASDTDPYGTGYNADTGIRMVSQPTVATASITTGTTASFDVTSMVAGWAAGAENRGFGIVLDSGNPAGNLYWAGKADAVQSYRPELLITYSVPEPASLGLLGIGATFMLRRRSK